MTRKKTKTLDYFINITLIAMTFALPAYFYHLKDEYAVVPHNFLSPYLIIGIVPILGGMMLAELTYLGICRITHKNLNSIIEQYILLIWLLSLSIISFIAVSVLVPIKGWSNTQNIFTTLAGMCFIIAITPKIFKYLKKRL